MVTHDCEVLVVGLGPVGAVAALYLARRGIKVAAIDASARTATDLRASTFHAPTIEMLDDLGVSRTLLGQGLKAPVYQYRDRQSGEVLAFDLSELSDHTRFPYRIQCEQHLVTAEILDTLRAEGRVRMAHRTRALYLEQDDDGVVVHVENDVSIERYRAKYVIGADGSNSVIRKLLELDFPGFTYDEKFLCLSTTHPLERYFDDLAYVNYISDPDEWMVLLRVPTLWRVLVPAAETTPDEDLLSDVNKDQIFQRMLKDDTVVETKHRTIYRVHQRVVSRFAVGRTCLVGDAAHLNSPMGGFGMNSGIHDAVNLADKLVRSLRDDADGDDLIGLYDRQRRLVTTGFVQAQTIENTRLMRNGWTSARDERRAYMQRLQNDAVERRRYLLKQSMFTSLDEAAAVS